MSKPKSIGKTSAVTAGTASTTKPNYCTCDGDTTAPKRASYCRSCGSRLNGHLVKGYHCLQCGLVRVKNVMTCPKRRWWLKLLGIEHSEW